MTRKTRIGARLEPGGEITPVRAALEPFGLASDDDDLWAALEPRFKQIASDYLEFNSELTRPQDVISQLAELETSASRFGAALRALGPVATDRLLVHQAGDGALSRRAREKGKGPKTFHASALTVGCAETPTETAAALAVRKKLEVTDRMWRLFFEPELRDLRAETPDPLALRLKQSRVEGAMERVRREGMKPGKESKYTIDDESPEGRRAWAILDAASEELGLFMSRQPYAVPTKAAERVAAVAAAAGQARRGFEEEWPLEDGGGPSPLLFGSPGRFLVESCGLTILYVFGPVEFKKIKSTPAGGRSGPGGRFANLLTAVHAFAFGDEASVPSFREALEWAPGWRDKVLAHRKEWLKEHSAH